MQTNCKSIRQNLICITSRQRYAVVKGIPLENVSLRMLEEDDKGVVGWAYDEKGGTNARSPLGQACRRALARDGAAAATHKWLPAKLQQAFRNAWAMHRSFNFLKETRAQEVYHSKETKKKYTWKTFQGLAKSIGDPDDPECCDAAWRYATNCWNMPQGEGIWWKWHAWFGVFMYCHEEDEDQDVWGESEKATTEASTTENLWETAAKEEQAKAAWAAAKKEKVENVDLEQIRTHKLGIDGWAELAQEQKKPGPTKGTQRNLKRATSDASKSGKSGHSRRASTKRFHMDTRNRPKQKQSERPSKTQQKN